MQQCRMGVKFEHFDEFEAKLGQFVVRKLLYVYASDEDARG
jgi:hypothetical protein